MQSMPSTNLSMLPNAFKPSSAQGQQRFHRHRPGLEQVSRYLRVAISHGVLDDSWAVGIGTGGEEQSHDLGVAEFHGFGQDRDALRRLGIWIGARLKEHPRHLGIALNHGPNQYGDAGSVVSVGIGPGVEKHLQYLGFATPDSLDHNRLTIRCEGVGVGAGVQQRSHDFRVAKLDGYRQGRTAVCIPVVGVGAGPERNLDDRRPTFSNVVQQQRIVAENQPSQEKQKHGPSKRGDHCGVQDEPKSGCHSTHLTNVRRVRLAVLRIRTGRLGAGLLDSGPRVERRRDVADR